MAVHLAQRRFDQSVPISQHRWFEPVRKYVALDIEGANHIDDYGFFPYGAKGRTPFNAIFGLLRGSTQWLPQIQWPVQLWVLALFSCGVDLLRYGRNEKRLHQQQVVKYGRRISNYATKSGQPSSRISVIAITYGSRPEHWRVWWAFEYEDFAGDFWHLIEQSGTEEPELAIPGIWIEEPVNPMDVENDRVDEWYREERPPLIWSEYRKIRPPT
ncbi:Ankyrin repeat-containing protein [Colletotrichum kahawae]|uniref:Ankyrin repeat-containing protein n=1 Tax=Colletotrichum kahawae TaxID=34407 RepID=A0AAD9YDY4_COLKA|nr:Ankyrin repeat-containing protein [Colletotrichum kahawae]